MVFTSKCFHRRPTDDDINEDRFECAITVNDTITVTLIVNEATTLIEAELASIADINSQSASGN